MKKIRVNIAAQLPANVAKHAAEISSHIATKSDAYFILDNVNFFPHITLYSPAFPQKNKKKVIDAVNNLAKKSPSIPMQVKDIESEDGFINVTLQKTKEIVHIHNAVIKATNTLREGCIRKKYATKEFQEKITKEEQHNINEYGKPRVQVLFDPHVTLSRLADAKTADALVKGITWDIPQWTCNAIALYAMGEHGTCIKLLKKFELSSN